eukprot:TRINITY_DN29832_c0_g1_i3.p1 TRINITY_DN29832_c0_g1~~TRINITY_DN29832_c0_g1_i3.p1  ORF type:complete len:959 (+),score=251.80 TRINITY_DN29832_c0_g1_i3:47-2923(+)
MIGEWNGWRSSNLVSGSISAAGLAKMAPASPRVSFFDDMELEKFLQHPHKAPPSTTSTEAETGPSESDTSPPAQQPTSPSCHSEEEDCEPEMPPGALRGKRRMSEMSTASISTTWSTDKDASCESSSDWNFGSRRNSNSSSWEPDTEFDAHGVAAATASIRRERDRLMTKLRAANDEVDSLQRERDEALVRLQEVEKRLMKAETKDFDAMEQKGREAELQKRLGELESQREDALSRARDAEERVRRSSVASQDADGVMAAAATELAELRDENDGLRARAEAMELDAAELHERLQAVEERSEERDREAHAQVRAAEERAAALEAKLASVAAQLAEAQAHGEDAAMWAHRQTAVASTTASRLRSVLMDMTSSNELLRSSQFFYAWRFLTHRETQQVTDQAASRRSSESAAEDLRCDRYARAVSSSANTQRATQAAGRLRGRICAQLEKQRSEMVLRSTFCMWRTEAAPSRPTRAVVPAASGAVPEHRRELGRQLSALTQQAAGLRSEVAKLLEKRKSRQQQAAAVSLGHRRMVPALLKISPAGARGDDSPRQAEGTLRRSMNFSPTVETFDLADGDSDRELPTPRSGIVVAAARQRAPAAAAKPTCEADLPQFGASADFSTAGSSGDSSLVLRRRDEGGSSSPLAQFGQGGYEEQESKEQLEALAPRNAELSSPLSQPPQFGSDADDPDVFEAETYSEEPRLRSERHLADAPFSRNYERRPAPLAPQFGSSFPSEEEEAALRGAWSMPRSSSSSSSRPMATATSKVPLASMRARIVAETFFAWKMLPSLARARSLAFGEGGPPAPQPLLEQGSSTRRRLFHEEEAEQAEEQVHDDVPEVHLPQILRRFDEEDLDEEPFQRPAGEEAEEEDAAEEASSAAEFSAAAFDVDLHLSSSSEGRSAGLSKNGGLRREVMEHLEWCKAIAAARSDRAAASGRDTTGRCSSSAFDGLVESGSRSPSP